MVATPDDILNWAFPRTFPEVLSPQPNRNRNRNRFRKLSHQIEFQNHKFHGSLAPIPTHPRIGPYHVNLMYLSLIFFFFLYSKILKILLWISFLESYSDEVGFVHPTQFATMTEDSTGDAAISDGTTFWCRDHKLSVSTQAVLPLYNACVYCGNGRVQETRRWRWWIGEWSDDWIGASRPRLSCCSAPISALPGTQGLLLKFSLFI